MKGIYPFFYIVCEMLEKNDNMQVNLSREELEDLLLLLEKKCFYKEMKRDLEKEIKLLGENIRQKEKTLIKSKDRRHNIFDNKKRLELTIDRQRGLVYR